LVIAELPVEPAVKATISEPFPEDTAVIVGAEGAEASALSPTPTRYGYPRFTSAEMSQISLEPFVDSPTKSHPAAVKVERVFISDVVLPARPAPQVSGVVAASVVSQNELTQTGKPGRRPRNPVEDAE
jgi:hypothetical protein